MNYLYRIKKDGTGLDRISDMPIQNKGNISPDGEWVIATVRVEPSRYLSTAAPQEKSLKACGLWTDGFIMSRPREAFP